MPTNWRDDFARDCFNDDSWNINNYHKVVDFIEKVESDTIRRCEEVVKGWKNDGENPTEADLVLENILKALHALLPDKKA